MASHALSSTQISNLLVDVTSTFATLISDPDYRKMMTSAFSSGAALAASDLQAGKIPFPSSTDLTSAGSKVKQPAPVDSTETSSCHVIKVELPVMKKDQVNVELEVEARKLVVSGEKKKEEVGDVIVKSYRAERCTGMFCRKMKLPENAKVEDVKAVMADGVLTITLPKAEVVVKSIPISAA